MWPFKKPPDLRDLLDAIDDVKRAQRGLRSDLDDLWNRFTRLQGRLAQRVKVEDTPPSGPESGEGAEQLSSPLSPMFSRLNDHQKRVQLEIMRRRATGGK